MTEQEKILHALKQIDPSRLEYQEWLNIGMALHHSGCSLSDFDSWSRPDKRYTERGCADKWKTFKGSGTPVTAGTIYKHCLDQGGKLLNDSPIGQIDEAMEWDDVISEKTTTITVEWAKNHEMPEHGADWTPTKDLRRYLEALFQTEEFVGYVTESYKNEDGKYLPKKGIYTRTAGELIAELNKYPDEIGNVVGDWAKDCGAWIRFNPLDGKGVSDSNIVDYRYALVESDKLPIDKQYDMYKELELPITALVHSGKKSLHAIVRIEAKDFSEYKERVEFLYGICKKSGLEIDRQNKNPSRLSRMPGITRGNQKQWLVATNIGKASWQEWRDWIEALNDNLPDVENLSDKWDSLPPLAAPVIEGLLRHGHKMLVTGPSKAGKSFALIELAIALAEGRNWLGWECTQGRVLYVNLELDAVSCLHRVKDVYTSLGWKPDNVNNIDIWNLRGKSLPMDKLAPRLIRRAAKKKYIAVIIDPIYKVITGDENSAHEMSNFCNQFDKICAELGTSTIYCHHHSKGAQGNKRAADRASGSGVFARDPDATLDIIELVLDHKRRETITDRIACDKIAKMLDSDWPSWRTHISQDDSIVVMRLLGELQGLNSVQGMEIYKKADRIYKTEIATKDQFSAWRIEGTLREFPSFPARRCFFRYPVHVVDSFDLLKDARAEGELPIRELRQAAQENKADKAKQETINAYESLVSFSTEPITLKALADYLNLEESNVRKRLKKAGLKCKNNIISKLTTGDKDNED